MVQWEDDQRLDQYRIRACLWEKPVYQPTIHKCHICQQSLTSIDKVTEVDGLIRKWYCGRCDVYQDIKELF